MKCFLILDLIPLGSRIGSQVFGYRWIRKDLCVCVCQVLWLPPDLRSLVQKMDPDLQQTSGSWSPVEELQQNHIVQLNLHYSSMSTEMIRCVCVCVCMSVR